MKMHLLCHSAVLHSRDYVPNITGCVPPQAQAQDQPRPQMQQASMLLAHPQAAIMHHRSALLKKNPSRLPQLLPVCSSAALTAKLIKQPPKKLEQLLQKLPGKLLQKLMHRLSYSFFPKILLTELQMAQVRVRRLAQTMSCSGPQALGYNDPCAYLQISSLS